MKKLSKQDFLQLHADNLEQEIWLSEIDLMITQKALKISKDKKAIDKMMKIENNIHNKIEGLRARKNFVIGVINGTETEMDNPKEKGQGFTAV